MREREEREKKRETIAIRRKRIIKYSGREGKKEKKRGAITIGRKKTIRKIDKRERRKRKKKEKRERKWEEK